MNVHRRRNVDRDLPINNLHRWHFADESSEMLLQYDVHERKNLRRDRGNIALLYLLYVLQGIPLGLIATIPMLLQNRGASYTDQAEFSFASWPYSLKFLWAPIVDSVYVRSIGRRKTWLVPSQYIIGGFMIFLSYNVESWLGSPAGSPNTQALTLIFGLFNLLAATQDIAADGWALTLLRRNNISYASTCSSIGQTSGYFLGYSVFIALESKDFCNYYLRTVPGDAGFVTLPGFLWFWGICFMIITTLLAIFKTEDDVDDNEFTVCESYGVLLEILSMPSMQILAGILLTVKVTFAACDAVNMLKLIDAGVPRETLALLDVIITPLQIFMPFFLSNSPQAAGPLEMYKNAIPYRMVGTTILVLLTYITPYLVSGGSVPTYYIVILILSYGFYRMFMYCMSVSIMAFFANISDPAVGGTYMTVLNTLSNVGGKWPSTIVLWLVDVLSWKTCDNVHPPMKCLTQQHKMSCEAVGGKCRIIFDGYYLEAAICVFYGILWTMFARKSINYLQRLPAGAWLVVSNFY